VVRFFERNIEQSSAVSVQPLPNPALRAAIRVQERQIANMVNACTPE
jgi:hypothetical protein